MADRSAPVERCEGDPDWVVPGSPNRGRSIAHVPSSHRLTWAQLLERVFAFDALTCPYGGPRKLIARVPFATAHWAVAMRGLEPAHRGLPHRRPGRAQDPRASEAPHRPTTPGAGSPASRAGLRLVAPPSSQHGPSSGPVCGSAPSRLPPAALLRPASHPAAGQRPRRRPLRRTIPPARPLQQPRQRTTCYPRARMKCLDVHTPSGLS